MAQPNIFCDQCGQRLIDAKFVDETVILEENSKAIGDKRFLRMFEGECPEHGHRFVYSPNEGHSTLLAARLQKKFSKAEQLALRDRLTVSEIAKFRMALKGQYAWDDDDLTQWIAALSP